MAGKEYPWGASISLQKDEAPLRWIEGCKEFFGDREFSKGKIGSTGFLIVTNQRVLFASKMGFFSSNYGVTYAINLEDIVSTSSGKFGFNDKLVILDKNGLLKEFIKPHVQTLVPIINEAISKKKEAFEAQKKSERVQIVLDFTFLKDAMQKGGLIMSTFKCPNCSASLRLPDQGKVLVCEYCNTPIKPIDIFEKIKSLIE